YPADCSEALAAALALAGAVVTSIDDFESAAIAEAAMLVVELADEPMRRLRHIERVAEDVGLPVLVVADPSSLPLIERANGITDLLLEPLDPVELGVRLRRQVTTAAADEVLRFKDLELNPLTYQATLDGRPLDLT